MPAPILTPSTTVVTPLIDAIVAARPNALGPMNNGGRYTALPTIAKAQTDVVNARLADEVQSARLRFSTGTSLRVLAQSEFDTSLPAAPQTAYATVYLARSSGPMAAGVIRQGQRFAKQANPNATPLPIAAATYTVSSTIYVPQDQTWAVVQLTAVSAGDDPNVPNFGFQLGTLFGFTMPAVGETVVIRIANGPTAPLVVGGIYAIGGAGIFELTAINSPLLTFENLGDVSAVEEGTAIPFGATYAASNTQIQPSDPLFDTNFQTTSCEASGGSGGLTDPILVAAARANAIGGYGPNDGALVAGVLSLQSVRFYAFFRANETIAYSQGYVADETWSSGQFWTSLVSQNLITNFLGFGCRVRFGTIVNQLIAVTADIVLKNSNDLANTSDIDSNVSLALRNYFDGLPINSNDTGRLDWYSFRLTTLQAVISQADARIQTCTDVTVKDANTGIVIEEPPATFGQVWSPTLTHFYVGASADGSDNSFTGSYLPPS